MSFGFAVGDFIAVGKLIADISLSLRDVGGSSSEYQELLRELDNLQRALLHIDKLKARQQPAINAIKCAALMCQHPLCEFRTRIQRYDGSLGLGQSRGKLYDWKNKAQWKLFKGEEVTKLRNYLNAHVGSINMLLMTHGLEMLDMAMDQSVTSHDALEKKMNDSEMAIGDIKDQMLDQSNILQKNRSLLGQIFGVISGDMSIQLRGLVDLVGKVWRTNLQVYNIILRWETQTIRPDIRFTWFQDPVKLEDALGRFFPIPSEYDHAKVSAIIKAHFRDGPCHRLVAANKYELFNVKRGNMQITSENWTGFLPGAFVKMAAIVEKASSAEDGCPMPYCTSTTFVEAPGGARTCSLCNVWMTRSSTKRKADRFLDTEEDQIVPKRTKTKTTATPSSDETTNQSLMPSDNEVEDEIELLKNIRIQELQQYCAQCGDLLSLPANKLERIYKQTTSAGTREFYSPHCVKYFRTLAEVSQHIERFHGSQTSTCYECTSESKNLQRSVDEKPVCHLRRGRRASRCKYCQNRISEATAEAHYKSCLRGKKVRMDSKSQPGQTQAENEDVKTLDSMSNRARPKSNTLMSDMGKGIQIYEGNEFDAPQLAVTDTEYPKRAAAPKFGDNVGELDPLITASTSVRRGVGAIKGETIKELTVEKAQAWTIQPRVKGTEPGRGPLLAAASGPSPQKKDMDAKKLQDLKLQDGAQKKEIEEALNSIVSKALSVEDNSGKDTDSGEAKSTPISPATRFAQIKNKLLRNGINPEHLSLTEFEDFRMLAPNLQQKAIEKFAKRAKTPMAHQEPCTSSSLMSSRRVWYAVLDESYSERQDKRHKPKPVIDYHSKIDGKETYLRRYDNSYHR